MLRLARASLRRAGEGIRRSLKLQGVAVATIALAVGVLWVAVVGLHAVERAAARWQQSARVVAFLAPALSEADTEALRRALEAWPEVAQVHQISAAETLAELRSSLADDPGLEGVLAADLLGGSLELELAPDQQAPQRLEALGQRLKALPGVEAVDWGADLLLGLDTLRRSLEIGGLVVAALVGLAVVFILSNTVRLALYARREELEIMQLVGATDGFIRAPYHLEAAAQGALGAALALAVSWGLHQLLLGGLSPALDLGAVRLPVPWPPAAWHGWIIGGAAAVGVLASHLATGRYLRGER